MGSGVYRYDGKTLTNFLNNNDYPFNLGAHYQAILNMLQDKNGNIWFCSWNGGGVWRYDGKSFTNYLPPADYYQRNEDGRSADKNYLTIQPAVSNNSLPQDNITDDMIFSISEDRVGNLWFATFSVLEDNSGNLWFGTRGFGLSRYDGKTFTNFSE